MKRKQTMTVHVLTAEEIRRRRARRDYMRSYRARKGKATAPRPYVTSTVVPREVEAEREATFSAPLSPGQILLGDPLPGRSALDKKMAAANKRRLWPWF
jgi:hypothetical protein